MNEEILDVLIVGSGISGIGAGAAPPSNPDRASVPDPSSNPLP